MLRVFYSPFISPGHAGAGITKRDRRDILPENNAGVPLIPQLLTNNAEDFLYAAEILRDYGYKELNLNLGCPSGTVTAKKKGSGFLTELPALRHFFEEVFRNLPADTKLGVKTRLGVKDPAEFPAILEIYNDFRSRAHSPPRIRRSFTGERFTSTCFLWQRRGQRCRSAITEISSTKRI